MDSLPMCIDLGRVQGCEDSLGCHKPGHEVSNRGANLMWRSIAWSRPIPYSGLALHDYIVAGSIILRPAIAKTRNGAIDHRRASSSHSLVTEPKAFHGTRPKILNQHIR